MFLGLSLETNYANVSTMSAKDQIWNQKSFLELIGNLVGI